MRMHGCTIGLEHYGHGKHGFGPKCHGFRHHGPHHRPHRGPHHRFHLGPRYGPHYETYRGAFVPLGKAFKGKIGPIGGTPGLYDRFVDDNGFEWRLHLPSGNGPRCEGGKPGCGRGKSGCESDKSGCESDKSDCENSKESESQAPTCRRRCWGKRIGRHGRKSHGRESMGHRGHSKPRGCLGCKCEGKNSKVCCKYGKPRSTDVENEQTIETQEGTSREVQNAPTTAVSLDAADAMEKETV